MNFSKEAWQNAQSTRSKHWALEADEWRLDALDASLEMFIRQCLNFPEVLKTRGNHKVSSHQSSKGLCVCGLTNDKTTSSLLWLA